MTRKTPEFLKTMQWCFYFTKFEDMWDSFKWLC